MISKIKIEKSHALLIGVGQRPTDSPAFVITEKDAFLMQQRLINDFGFDENKIQLITKPNTYKSSILSQLDTLIENTKDGTDLVIVFFSGHGAKIEDNFYLVALDSLGKENLIKSNEFVERLGKINADKLLVLLDCCHAAGVAEYEYTAMFDNTTFFNQDNNRAVIASSRSGEYSYLGNEYSLFTAAVANALHGDCLFAANSDQKVYLLDFAAYVYAIVSNANNNQHPQMKILNNGKISNFVIVDYTDGTPNDDMPISELFEFGSGKKVDLGKVSKEEFNKVKENFERMIKNSVIGSTINVGENFHIGDNIVTVDGQNNIVIKDANNNTITINQSTTPNEIIEVLKTLSIQIKELSEKLTSNFKINSNLAIKMEKSAELNQLYEWIDEEEFDKILIHFEENKEKFSNHQVHTKRFMDFLDWKPSDRERFKTLLKTFIIEKISSVYEKR